MSNTNPIAVFSTSNGLVASKSEGRFQFIPCGMDALFREENPARWLSAQLTRATALPGAPAFLAPIESQEVWAAGVTYLRSCQARAEESKEAGGGTFYDRVYDAERPELFFKATPQRVVGSGGVVRLRSDSRWNVPEPEVALAINSSGRIFGYTIGNDMSSRDIEGENPLYLPQAKVYAACCGLGPGVVVREALPRETVIAMEIERGGKIVFAGGTSLQQMKRGFEELAEFLFRDNTFPDGCFLLTGTGVVPPNDFTLQTGDTIRIRVDGLGMLVNAV